MPSEATADIHEDEKGNTKAREAGRRGVTGALHGSDRRVIRVRFDFSKTSSVFDVGALFSSCSPQTTRSRGKSRPRTVRESCFEKENKFTRDIGPSKHPFCKEVCKVFLILVGVEGVPVKSFSHEHAKISHKFRFNPSLAQETKIVQTNHTQPRKKKLTEPTVRAAIKCSPNE